MRIRNVHLKLNEKKWYLFDIIIIIGIRAHLIIHSSRRYFIFIIDDRLHFYR